MTVREDVLVSPRAEHRRQYWDEFDRDDYECPDCGRGLDEVEWFEVHHKDGDHRNGDLDNLVALCHHCHRRRHRRENVDRRLQDMRALADSLGGEGGGSA